MRDSNAKKIVTSQELDYR